MSEFDFVSDEKEHKQRARVMLEMVMAINRDFMPRLSSGEAAVPNVTCMTCHRGKAEPEVEEAGARRRPPPPVKEAVAHPPYEGGSALPR